MTRLLILLLCLCGIGQVLAETRYVTDQTQIMMRKGESTRYKIIRSLPSGAAVEELGKNEATGYSRIRAADGAIGYVLTDELQDEPAARNRLAAMEGRLAELQQAPNELASRLNRLQSEHDELLSDHKSLEEEKARLEQELTTIKNASSNLVQLTQERAELRMRVAELTREQAGLQQENQDLRNDVTQRWFLIGAGVMILGILIGLLLPHLRFRRRKSSWGSL